jgi:acetyl esterase
VTLHPQVVAVVEQMASRPAPNEMPLHDARASLDAGDVLAGAREDVFEVIDREIPGPRGPIPVRAYRPCDATALPVAVYLHGGGFTMGSLESHDRLCRALANRSGCLVVAVDYRLAPEHPFPAGIDDADAATTWVAAHAGELGGDPDRVAIGGDSGGGTFGAVVSMLARDRGAPELRFQYLLNPGGLDFDYTRPSCEANADGCFLTMDLVRWIEGQYFSRPDQMTDPRAALNLAPDLSGMPPAIVITAEHDPVRDQGLEYVRRLREAGVPVQHTDYPGMIHGFVNFKGAIDDGERALDELAAAIHTALGAA